MNLHSTFYGHTVTSSFSRQPNMSYYCGVTVDAERKDWCEEDTGASDGNKDLPELSARMSSVKYHHWLVGYWGYLQQGIH